MSKKDSQEWCFSPFLNFFMVKLTIFPLEDESSFSPFLNFFMVK